MILTLQKRPSTILVFLFFFFLNLFCFPKLSGEDGVSILELGELQEVVVDISVTNTGESAYEASLYVSHPRTLSFIGRVSEANQLLCNSFNSTLVTCSLGNPFKHG
jgi:hypothetical protein